MGGEKKDDMSSIESIINRQLERWELEKKIRAREIERGKEARIKPIVALSRMKGSGGVIIASKLADRLHYQLLHREIIDDICNSSGYQRQIIEALDKGTQSRIELWIEGLLKGAYVNFSDYLRHLYKVIMSIAEHGGVVVVERGANFIIPRDQIFSLRIVAAKEQRIENLIQYKHYSKEGAQRIINESDRERANFIHAHFKKNIDDPLAYDLVIDTGFIDIETAVAMAESAISSKWKKLGILPSAPSSGLIRQIA